ncbi:hypothetical protein SGLAD_v1c04620 [Spiroplasma gladiatoris]|uniref:Lipoprotein n=1 Tax=Spiroplasma gladiatoris TaxID=2143 RepID=A0A4P7AHQ0_9MOLU|nr:hypothetical protein [Spiroplasma gladiatoris]QBQ07661.1 hypothetical protein SGLAD_v1c04620 [Spiroplasma gladiatoris]
MKKILSLLMVFNIISVPSGLTTSCFGDNISKLGSGNLEEIYKDRILNIEEKSMQGVLNAIDKDGLISSSQVIIEGVDPAEVVDNDGFITIISNENIGSDLYGSIEVKWVALTNLEDALTTKSLGKLRLNKKDILDWIIALNPDIQVEEVEIDTITKSKAKVVAINDSNYYYGSTWVDYVEIEDDSRESLEDAIIKILPDKYLGEITKIDEGKILNRINSSTNDESLKIDTAEVMTHVKGNKVILSSIFESTKYKGYCVLTYKDPSIPE